MRVYLNQQPKQRVYVSGPSAGQVPQKKKIYVSGPQAGQVAQPKILQQPKAGASGLAQNFKTDFSSFAKGILGLGRQAVTHPVDTGGKVLGIGKEIVKGIPEGARAMAAQYAHPVENFKKGYESFQQLRQIPLDEQKKALQEMIQKVGDNKEAKENPDKRRMAQIGLALLGNYSQYSRPGEKIYNEPFSFALDTIPVAKTLGVGKAASFAGKQAQRIPVVAKGVEKASEIFVPGAKLNNLGYGKVADDLQNTGTAMRQAQEGIIKSTVSKFKNVSKEERVQFFDAIDSLRRTPDVVPSHPNPKVQGMIDWYMKEELPRIKKISGITRNRAEAAKAVASQLSRKQERALHLSLKEMSKRESGAKTFTSGVRVSGKPTRYTVEDILKSVKKELGYKTKRKSPLYPSAVVKTTGETIPVRTRMSRSFIDKQLGVRDLKPVRGTEAIFRPGVFVKSADRNNVGRIVSVDGENAMVKFVNKTNKTEATVSVPVEKLSTLDKNISKQSIPQLEKILEEYRRNPDGIKNYLHHFFNPTSETRMGGKLSAPQRGFLKQSKDVEGFVKDPVVSIAGVKSKAAVANIKDSFIARVTKQYARPADTVTEFKNGTILAKDTGEPLIKWKGQYLPKDLGEELLRYEGKGKGIIDTMLTPLRVFNRNWKPLATAVRPRYHLRNIIGNVYNASFVGGAGLQRYPQAVWQQMKGYIATQMREGTFAGQVYKALFKTPPEHSMIKMATEDGVIGRGFFSADINDLAEIADTAEDFTKAIAKMENPAEIYRVPVLRQWLQASSAIGSAFEDNARLALYMSQIKSGATRAAAKAYVNKHLFDYINGLGEGDRAIKAIIPFWSWTRFNVPLQYGSLWKNPIRNVVAQEFGKPYVQQNEQNNPEYKYLSQREKDLGAVKIEETTKDGKTTDKYMRTQGVLPIQDIGKVLDPENAGLSPLFDMLNQAYRYVSPPTNPNQNLDYFGRPVEQYTGEQKRFLGIPVRGTTKEILQSIPALSELNKGFGGSYNDQTRPDLSSRLGTVFSPTSQTLQDREKNRQYAESDYNTLVKGDFAPGLESNFKYVIKGLLDNPTDSVLNQNKDTLVNLLKQQGYTDEGIKILIKKSIESVIKDQATINPIGKGKNIIETGKVNDILKKANQLTPFYTK